MASTHSLPDPDHVVRVDLWVRSYPEGDLDPLVSVEDPAAVRRLAQAVASAGSLGDERVGLFIDINRFMVRFVGANVEQWLFSVSVTGVRTLLRSEPDDPYDYWWLDEELPREIERWLRVGPQF
jgi:hypothetical protein